MSERRKQVEVSDEHHDRLHKVARHRGDSLSDVVHEALELFLTEVVPDPDEATGADAASEESNASTTDDPAAPSR